MIKLNMQQLLFTAFALTLSAFSLSTQAHELRSIGDGYWIQVGGHIEPPYTHIWNGIDFFPFHEEGPLAFPDDAVSLNKLQGDKVVIEAFGLIEKTVNIDPLDPLAAFDAPTEKVFLLDKPWQQVDYYGYAQYFQEKAFVINKPTAYGFYVQGTLQRMKPDGTFYPLKHFHEKFICGNGTNTDPNTGAIIPGVDVRWNGTQDVTYGTYFECTTNDPNAPPRHHDKHIHLEHHND